MKPNSRTRSINAQRQRQAKAASRLPYAFVLLICLLIWLVFSQAEGLLPSLPGGEIDTAEPWLRLDVIDVGQGDCLLLSSSLGESMLIDAGSRNQSEVVLNFLQQRQISHLDYVVATHPHEDHIGGMVAVLNAISVGTFYMPDAIHTTLLLPTCLLLWKRMEFVS